MRDNWGAPRTAVLRAWKASDPAGHYTTVFALVASSLASASNMNYIRTRDQTQNTQVQTSIEA
jgi:hypothetical protein